MVVKIIHTGSAWHIACASSTGWWSGTWYG